MYSALYLLFVIAINIGFAHTPLFHGWPPLSLAVGLVFVLRDFAQREIGHKVVGVMLVGALLSYFMASPAIALASCAAYVAGEVFEWAVYTWTERPFRDRVLLSCLIGAPIDSVVFLTLIGAFSLSAVFLMTVSKMLGAGVVYLYLRRSA